MKILRSNKLVAVSQREVERHRIMQIFLSSVAYLFIYDLDSLPKNIDRYFYPVSLERARVFVSLLLYDKKLSLSYKIEDTPDAINHISENLSRHLVITAKYYESGIINHGDERYVYEIYGKAMTSLLKENKKQISYIEKKSSFLLVQDKHYKPIFS